MWSKTADFDFFLVNFYNKFRDNTILYRECTGISNNVSEALISCLKHAKVWGKGYII